MSEFDKQDMDCIEIQKKHGPGGELPAFSIGTAPKAVDAPWEPVKPRKSELTKVRDMALKIIPYAVMSTIIFWWQQSGQLAETTGFYTLIILALLGGINVGKCCRE